MLNFDDRLHVRSGSLEVRCYQLSDRTGHSLIMLPGEQIALEIMRSVEGDSDEEFPPSGVMQEMVSENASVGKQPVLMGLGSAGKSHWSCCIEADSTIESIAFDFACKTRAMETFGSTYELIEGVECNPKDDRMVELSMADQPVMYFRCFGNSTMLFDQEKNRLSIVSAIPADDLKPALKIQRRWRYVFGLAESLTFASDV